MKSGILHAVNMELTDFVPIFISYSPRTILKSVKRPSTVAWVSFQNGLGQKVRKSYPRKLTEYRSWNTLYVRLGVSVLSIVRSSRQEALLPTLRRMLTVLSLYPLFLRYQPQGVSASTLDFWVERFLERNLHWYSQLPLKTLLKASLTSVNSLAPILYHTRISVTTTPDVKGMLIQIHLAVCDYIRHMKKQDSSIHLVARP